jgi:FtsP/CotA-like multicopper oxidase with cupredoxin domain
VAPWSPDPFAPAGLTTYVFGFRDVTSLDANPQLILNQKGHVQNSAPFMIFDENDNIQITLTNRGLKQRPDLVDSHTIHWHGFRNALPAFDGVPEMSISVPIDRDFPYFYHPHDPGTYMYHCHFEDVEHVQMGMTGVVFVRPAQVGGRWRATTVVRARRPWAMSTTMA